MEKEKVILNILDQRTKKEKEEIEEIKKQLKRKEVALISLEERLSQSKKVLVKSIGKYRNSFSEVSFSCLMGFNLKIDYELEVLIKKMVAKTHGGVVYGKRNEYMIIQNLADADCFDIIKTIMITEITSIEEIIILAYDLMVHEKMGKGPLYNADYKKSVIVNLGFTDSIKNGFASVRIERKKTGNTPGEEREFHLHFQTNIREYRPENSFLVKN
jgi:hypothetical protein